ncbi:sigma-54-dependent Fis family transcriptional regulator [Bacteroidia bacterium]|nr:sigma-54-dependent Fis family transcriptional regulator [Bacteroidia bacterium]
MMQTSEIQTIKQRFGIIGNTEQMNRAIDVAVQVAPTDLSVLVQGESGVGKEFFPQIIHQFSARKHGKYIAVNCGAIPEGTIDSELFGHIKGSFTGAMADRKGYFEEANGGTIFLDEVGELPLSTQVRLLRVLESGEYIRVGSSEIRKTNVRVVAATNLNMQQATQDGRFREDLYYRLNTVPIFVPPLRDRKEDIELLFRRFALDFSEKYNMPPIRLAEEAKQVLVNYRWNGNVRQLKNITEQISVIEHSREISAATLRNYLPSEDVEYFPALFPNRHQTKDFGSEREILYQILFDMRKDINDLKQLLHTTGTTQPVQNQTDISFSDLIKHRDAGVPKFAHAETVTPDILPVQNTNFRKFDTENTFQDVEYQEDETPNEPMTLDEMEKQMIQRTLEKYRGRRKSAAYELKISERTLYRKIKDFGLE